MDATDDDLMPRPLPKPSGMQLPESIGPEVPEVSLVFDLPPRESNMQKKSIQNKMSPDYRQNGLRNFSESSDTFHTRKHNQVENHGRDSINREFRQDISPRFDRYSQISDNKQITFSPSIDRTDNCYRETDICHDNDWYNTGLKNYYNKPAYKNSTFDTVNHNHAPYSFSNNIQRNNFQPQQFQSHLQESRTKNNCMCPHNESQCIEKPSINLFKADRLRTMHDYHLSNRTPDVWSNIQLQQTVERHEAQLKFLNEKSNELATNSYASQLMKKYEERIENICEIFKNKFVTVDEFEKILQKYSEKIIILENQNKQLLVSLDNIRSNNIKRNDESDKKCCIHCKDISQASTKPKDNIVPDTFESNKGNLTTRANVNFVEIKNPIDSVENVDQISSNTPKNQILKEVQNGNVVNLNVGYRGSPQSPQINQNFEPVMRETNHATEGKVELSWTFYNRIVEDVRKVMHNDDQSGMQERNKLQLDPMEMVRKATLEHLQKMGISLTNNAGQMVNKENEPRPIVSRNSEDQYTPNSNNYLQDKDLSCHMNSLALKYVSNEYSPRKAEEKMEAGLRSPINNNVSIATLQYLERYHLLPQSSNTPTGAVKDVYQHNGYIDKPGQYMSAAPSDRMLDATAIKQQPKLL